MNPTRFYSFLRKAHQEARCALDPEHEDARAFGRYHELPKLMTACNLPARTVEQILAARSQQHQGWKKALASIQEEVDTLGKPHASEWKRVIFAR